MGTLPAGYTGAVPDQPGRWQLWSPAADAPGAHFFVPASDEARATGIKYLVVRVVYPRTAAQPTLSVLRAVTS